MQVLTYLEQSSCAISWINKDVIQKNKIMLMSHISLSETYIFELMYLTFIFGFVAY